MDLTQEQIKKIKNFKNRLFEVETSSLETTLNNFRGEQDPNREIAVWEQIADRYEELIGNAQPPDIEQKKELFKKALTESFYNPETPIVVTKSPS